MNNTISLPMLERVRVASPCHVKWEDMAGDDRVRHCDACDLNVHNIAAMTRDEAEAFLSNHFDVDGTSKAGRVCGVLYRRADGTILTRDCPVGLARVKAAARVCVAKVAALVGLTALVGWVTSKASANGWDSLTNYEPIASLTKVVSWAGVTKPPSNSFAVMGSIAPMPLPTPPPPARPPLVDAPPSNSEAVDLLRGHR